MLYVQLCPVCNVRVKRMNGYVFYCPECGRYHDSDDVVTVGQWEPEGGPGEGVASLVPSDLRPSVAMSER